MPPKGGASRDRVETSVYEQVVTSVKELNDALISQHLKLLSNLRFHVEISGVQAGQFVLEGVDILQAEHLLIQPTHAGQDIGSPAA